MFTRLRRLSLAGQLLVALLAVVLVVLSGVGLVAYAQSEAQFSRIERSRMLTVAEDTATNGALRAGLSDGIRDSVLSAVAAHTQNTSNLDLALVALPDGEVLAGTDPTLRHRRLPIPDVVADPQRSWRGEVRIDGQGFQLASAPVMDLDGEVLGVVVTGVRQLSAADRMRGAMAYLPAYLGLAALTAMLGAWLVSRWIKRQTLGMEPGAIAGLAEHRKAILQGIADGVVALDTSGRVTLVNDPAKRLLDLPERCRGRSLEELGLGGRVREVLRGDRGDGAQVVVWAGHTVVMRRLPLLSGQTTIGSVTTVRDRTEALEMRRELSGYRSTANALRAQTHEFTNQLHTISGLLQIGEYDEVVRFVGAVQGHHESLDLQLRSAVRDSALASLLMAKTAVAAERKVRLVISAATHVGRLDPAASLDVGTVLGNLVDNAIEASSGRPEATVEVELTHTDDSLQLTVTDTGPGLADHQAEELFSYGYTSKEDPSARHGVGLALSRSICVDRGGSIEVVDTGHGARFTAVLAVQTAADRESVS
ncbi:MAG TPA: ATP-binding protein [Segeticoccus sp.]|uniref:sensor histidine kinase n=1 Tax=Segeticoccus sp. TaxID=2706531 RepID=UPI002D7FADA6|nr:ATP-binding protein [Segeticoccus sp.]HET8598754.1 ATP-binding protein [Segeticoccus sp.]